LRREPAAVTWAAVGKTTKIGERRDTPRIPVALEAILHYRERDFLHAVTRDISLDGVYVRAPRASFARGEAEIAIRLPGEGEARYHRFRGQVAHVGRDGAGLSFADLNAEAYEALLGLVFARRSQGAA
jgi:hypothetical protein